VTGFDDLSLGELRRRRSAKWRAVDPDVLPVWVAELDVPLAPAVTRVLREAVDTGDTGYAFPVDLAPAFAGFAARRWGWSVDVARCWPVADVMVGVAEALRYLTAPGDGVVVCPPVYHPFFDVPAEHDRVVVQVPLTGSGALDLSGIDAALAAGATAVLLSSPHNPTGRVWTAGELQALDDVVRARGAVVVSDEIHAPLTLAGAVFTPYLAGGDREAVAVVSASKAFNLAGLKAALLVAGSPAVADRLAAVPEQVAYRCGHLGVLATVAAWRDGDAWLDALLAHLDRNRRLLAELLPDGVGYAPPQASYLAWLDLRGLGLGSPAAHLLEHGRVALVEGSDFGAPGAGFARLNLGTTRAVLEEAARRVRVACAVPPAGGATGPGRPRRAGPP
jgi:cysteine-S-conjugate beta-lyase